jgi:hypothetical protein
MAKQDPRVDEYVKFSAPFARPMLLRLRKLVHQGCPSAEETIKWNCPFFLYEGKILCFFAEFKAHIAFGFWGPEMKKVILGDGIKTGRGLLGRIKSNDDLPDDRTLLRYIKTAMKIHDAAPKARVVRRARPTLVSPPELVQALKRNPAAAANWEKFSPSARRDYIEWIVEAKRAGTREERLLTTIEWVGEGKRRHWKYEKC